MEHAHTFPRRLVFAASAAQDAILLVVGLTALVAPPQALRDYGAYGPAGIAWSLLLIVGAFLSFGGGIRDHLTLETVGCFCLAGGFVVWAIALISLGNDLLFWQYAGAMVAAALGQVRRGVLVASGVLLLLRPTPRRD